MNVSLFAWMLRYRIPVLCVLVGITGVFAAGLGKVWMNPDVEAYVPIKHPFRQYWIQAERDFALHDQVLVAVVADDGVFSPQILSGVATLTTAIESLDFVDETTVRSLSNADDIVGAEDSLDLIPFFEEPPGTMQDADAIRERVFSNPVYINRLVSPDATLTAITFRIMRSVSSPTDAHAALSALFDATPIPGARILMTGKPIVEAVYGRQMADDLARLIPLTLLAVIVVLFICNRAIGLGAVAVRTAIATTLVAAFSLTTGGSVSIVTPAIGVALALLTVPGALIPSLVVAFALVWTLGLQGWLDVPLYISSIIMPPILLAIGCADGIHLFERFRDAQQVHPARREAVLVTMEAMWRPVTLTSLTTAAGFAALMTADMTAYKSFGAFTAFGILAAMVLSLTLVPTILSFGPERLEIKEEHDDEDLSARLLARLAGFIIGNRGAVLAAGALVFAAALGATTRLKVDYSWVESLMEGTPVLVADRVLRERHGGTVYINAIVETPEPGGIKNPAVMQGMDRALAAIAKDPYVGDTRSIAEYVKRMHQAMHADRAEEYRIPDDRELIAQYLLLYSMSGDPAELEDMIDYSESTANMAIALKSDRMSEMARVVEGADAAMDQYLRPLGVSVNLTGSGMMQHVVLGLIYQGQVNSLVTATTLVFLILCLLYRSIWYAAVCMLPPAFAGALTFGFMGVAGIALGPSQAVISAIALGVGIDYSIHLVSRIREERRLGVGLDDAVTVAIKTTGRGVLFNCIVVVSGFTLLAFSRSPAIQSFGILIAGNMAACFAAALTVLPAALSWLGARRERESPTLATVSARP